MSQKNSKKLRQLYKRDVRHQFVKDGMMLNKFLRTRPRWCPLFFWRFMLRQVFEIVPGDENVVAGSRVKIESAS